MKKLVASIGFIVSVGAASAQQDYQFTHYMFDKLSFNPASAGIDGKLCATAMFRNQWSGFGGQPQTFLFNAQAKIPVIYGGAGLTFFSDKLGFQKNTVIRLHYSYQRGIGSIGTLGVGLSVGMIGVSYSPTWVAIDPVTGDAAIPDGNTSQSTYDLGLGVYLKGNGYYVGLSTTHLTESELTNVNFLNRRHYHIVGGYDWQIPSAPDFQLNPSLLVKTDATSTILDINLRCTWKQMIWLGVGYRMKDAIMPMLGGQYVLPNNKGTVRAGYAYDITTSDIKTYSSGSHDIFLNYCFDIVRPPKREKYKTVRFL